MTQLSDIIDLADLEVEINARYINRRLHPEFPELAILNYSDQAQFDNHWTPTVRACRGLIYNTLTMEVLARPFAKFFNYGQEDTTALDLDRPILGAWDKADGSLGIQYRTPDGKQAIATRGSFESEQAIHATAWLRENRFDVSPKHVTWLWEIVYPENRIVLDYKGFDGLIFIGNMLISSGAFVPPTVTYEDFDQIKFDQVKQLRAETLREALALPDRENAEGVVVWADGFTGVKIKQADYMALHRIISNLTRKEVWRQMRAETFTEFAAALPDEFHDWAKQEAAVLTQKYFDLMDEILIEYKAVSALATPGDRRDFATYAKVAKNSGFLFSLLDGKDISDAIWRQIEPIGN